MKALACALILLLLLGGCGGDAPTPAPGQDAPEQAAATEAQPENARRPAPGESAVITGMDFYLYAKGPTLGEARKPAFHLHADKVRQGSGETYILEGVQATIFGEGEGESESEGDGEGIRITSERGLFEQNKGAHLEGNVVGLIGDLRFEMAEATYTEPSAGESGIIHSSQPVRITGPGLIVTGASLRIDTRTLKSRISTAHLTMELRRNLQ